MLTGEVRSFPDFPCEETPLFANGMLLAAETKGQCGKVPKEHFVIGPANRPESLVINRRRTIRNLLQRSGDTLSILNAIIGSLIDRLDANSRPMKP